MPKRVNGSGSIYKRKDRGTWEVAVTLGYKPDGSPDRIRRSYRTKTEALQALTTIRNEQREKKAPTVANYYKAFCKGKGAAISKDKQDAYRIAYNRLEKFHGTPITDISVADIQGIINTSCKTHYPARDVRTILRHMLRIAAVEGIPVNIQLPDLLELPALNEQKREPFTEEEQIALWLSYEGGNLNAAYPLIMIYTGMMTGELRKLEKSMINWVTQEIVGDGLKTDERREKSILIPDDIVPVLQDVVSRAPQERILTMNEEDFYAMYYKALEDAGITRHLTPYSCRTTVATTLAVHREVAPQVLQRVMRWKSTKVMDKYVNPDDSAAREALNRL